MGGQGAEGGKGLGWRSCQQCKGGGVRAFWEGGLYCGDDYARDVPLLQLMVLLHLYLPARCVWLVACTLLGEDRLRLWRVYALHPAHKAWH